MREGNTNPPRAALSPEASVFLATLADKPLQFDESVAVRPRDEEDGVEPDADNVSTTVSQVHEILKCLGRVPTGALQTRGILLATMKKASRLTSQRPRKGKKPVRRYVSLDHAGSANY